MFSLLEAEKGINSISIILSCWAILYSTFMFSMKNIIITIIIHIKGRYLWSVTAAYIDNSFFSGGSHMFLLFCEEILKHYDFFPQYRIQEKHCLNPFLQLPFDTSVRPSSSSVLLGPFKGSNQLTKIESLPSLRCLIQQKALETPEQLLQSPNRGCWLVLMKMACLQNFCHTAVVGGIRGILDADRSIRG